MTDILAYKVSRSGGKAETDQKRRPHDGGRARFTLPLQTNRPTYQGVASTTALQFSGLIGNEMCSWVINH